MLFTNARTLNPLKVKSQEQDWTPVLKTNDSSQAYNTIYDICDKCYKKGMHSCCHYRGAHKEEAMGNIWPLIIYKKEKLTVCQLLKHPCTQTDIRYKMIRIN